MVWVWSAKVLEYSTLPAVTRTWPGCVSWKRSRKHTEQGGSPVTPLSFFMTGVLGNPPAPLQLHTGLCICPWVIIDRVATMPCNMRGGDLATMEQLERRPIRGFPCHPMGDIMQGKHKRGNKETPRRSGRPFLKEDGLQGDRVSLQLVARC